MISNSHFIFSSILLTPFFFITLTLSFPHHTNFHPSPITTTPPLSHSPLPSPPLPLTRWLSVPPLPPRWS